MKQLLSLFAVMFMVMPRAMAHEPIEPPVDQVCQLNIEDSDQQMVLIIKNNDQIINFNEIIDVLALEFRLNSFPIDRMILTLHTDQDVLCNNLRRRPPLIPQKKNHLWNKNQLISLNQTVRPRIRSQD